METFALDRGSLDLPKNPLWSQVGWTVLIYSNTLKPLYFIFISNQLIEF